MKKIRFTAILCAAMLLCGCGAAPTPIVTPSPTEAPAEGGWQGAFAAPQASGPIGAESHFDEVWRADVPFAEIEYEHYDRSCFNRLLFELMMLAENGGTAEEFDELDNCLLEELYYVFDMSTLAGLESYRDPRDSVSAEEKAYSTDLYYEMNTDYCLAMHALAISEYADVMAEIYPADYCAWFVGFAENSEASEQLSIENALVQRYYALMSGEETEEAAQVYIELVELRRKTAKSAGYASYADYAYENFYYKFYTAEDTARFAENVREYFVPVYKAVCEKVTKDTDRLWYADIDCSEQTILNRMGEVLPQIAPELGAAFDYMRDYGLYDIGYDGRKADIGFTTRLYYWNEPYIFFTPADGYFDYLGMFHEFGHFTNAYYTTGDLLFGMPDNDLCELQSQGLEMLMLPYYDVFFGERLAPLVEEYTIMNMLDSVITGALYDEFQRRVFEQTDLTPERINAIFSELCADYGYDVPEDEWIWVEHNFEYPFYFVSYAVSAIGALELYALSLTDWDAAVDTYLRISAMDTEWWEYSEALAEVGLGDFLSAETSRAAADAAYRALSD